MKSLGIAKALKMIPLKLSLSVVLIWLSFLIIGGNQFQIRPIQAANRLVHTVGEPKLVITHIDVDHFPKVQVYVTGENLGATLNNLSLTLKEDNQVQELLDDQSQPVGAQVALVWHVTPETQANGGQVQARQAVQNLTSTSLFSAEADWMAAYALTNSSGPKELHSWTPDLTAVVDSFISYDGASNSNDVPLYNLLSLLLEHFETSDAPVYLPKSLVLFSDGSDNGSTLRPEDVTEKAISQNIKIHVVLLPPGAPRGAANLQRLAALSGGQYYDLTNTDTLWTTLALEHYQQQVLAYRSKKDQPREITIEVRGNEGHLIKTASRAFPSITLIAPQLQLYYILNDTPVLLTDTLLITRQGAAYNTPLDELLPQTLTLQLKVTWSDHFTRPLAEMRYTLANQSIPITANPTLAIPIANLNQGDYSLTLEATGDVGPQGETDPILLRIRTVYPPLPWLWVTFGLVTILSLGIGAGYLWRKWRQPRVLPPEIRRPTGAQLLLVEGEGVPQQIDLYYGVNRLGRDPNQIARRKTNEVDIIIHHEKVSRLHCHVEVKTKSFRLINKSKMGTQVKMVSITGEFKNFNERMLQPHDEIKLGPVIYRFEPVKASLLQKQGYDGTGKWQ